MNCPQVTDQSLETDMDRLSAKLTVPIGIVNIVVFIAIVLFFMMSH